MKVRAYSGNRMVSTGVAIGLVVVMLAGAVFVQYALNSSAGATAGVDQSSPYDTARSVLDLLGGVRQTLAANLWSKTDSIHHDYLGENVFKEQALYPYFWLITRLDPHFTMAYYFASWILARLGRPTDGFDLALEGLRFNPDSAILQYNLASIYFFFIKDPLKARYHILKAIELTDDAGDKAVYESFLSSIENVIAGKRQIPEVVPPDVANRINQQLEKAAHGQGQ